MEELYNKLSILFDSRKGNGHLAVVSLEPQNKVPEKKSNGLKENHAPSKKLVCFGVLAGVL